MGDRLGSDRTNALLLVVAMVALMWITEVVDVVAGGSLDQYGIHPRDVDGLPEIVSAPFLHAGFGHLASNTIPFAIMGAAIALGGLARVAAVTAVVAGVRGARAGVCPAPGNPPPRGGGGPLRPPAGAPSRRPFPQAGAGAS